MLLVACSTNNDSDWVMPGLNQQHPDIINPNPNPNPNPGNNIPSGNLPGNGNIDNNQISNEQLQKLLTLIKANGENFWGKDEFVNLSRYTYVKYFDHYSTRSVINFEKNKITIATVSNNDINDKLKKAIVSTLLMPADPNLVHIFTDNDIELSGAGDPLLLGQVKDQDNQDVHWEWRANRFADYLLENKLQTKQFSKGTIHYVEIDMVDDSESVREYKYSDLARAASAKYGIDERLIYAIIKTESSFNPFAVSNAGAYGLMQIIPKTAGADVFSLVKHIDGQPSKEYLFDPTNNIDTGTAYFTILRDRYLKAVINPLSQHYSMISAYNGGTGGVLSTYDSDRSVAMEKLNQQTPEQVYQTLTHEHPKEEARHYLEKVTNFEKEFDQLD